VKRKNEVGFERESPTDETALERAERLANLLTLSYEPMLTWRLDGPIEFWNAGAERLYGFAQDEAVGRTSHALLRTEFPIDFADLRSQLKNRRNWLGELRHICKDGSKVVVERSYGAGGGGRGTFIVHTNRWRLPRGPSQ
jgi:PAS domain S-box-containing protein